MTPVLSVDELSVSYTQRGVRLPTLRGVSFQIAAGEAFALVGESGCGKTTAALAITRYLAHNGTIDSGSVRLDGEELTTLTERELRQRRGRSIGMVYQDPGKALNPVMTVGDQVDEIFRVHFGLSRADARSRTVEVFESVALPAPDRLARRYPHELSGGQQQRVVISMALASDPRLLILDEPTTNLDASVEAEIVELIAEIRRRSDLALLMISHNLGLVAEMCDQVGVLYAGRIVEEGSVRHVFDAPRHPYTLGLLRCVPRLEFESKSVRLAPIPGSPPQPGDAPKGCLFAPRCVLERDVCHDVEPNLIELTGGRRSRCLFTEEVPGIPEPPAKARISARVTDGEPLLTIRDVSKRFGALTACEDVTLTVGRGEILGLVGETGSGKTTVARCIAGLLKPDAGSIELSGRSLASKAQSRDGEALRALQMVFQNPDATLNRRHLVRSILARAIKKLRGHRTVEELAAEVQLHETHLGMRADALSGGLKQRVAIGRAFAGTPKLVICDEAVSSLDVSVQAGILNVLDRLAREELVSYIFISHDLAVVQYLSDRIAVMYLGQIIEVGEAEDVFTPPHHPYTEALLSAVPVIDERQRQRIRLRGEIPRPGDLPTGCRFHTRCPRKLEGICEVEPPPWHEAGGTHLIRCHIPPADLRSAQDVDPERGRAASA